MIDYHKIEPFTGRPMKGWKKDIDRLEKLITGQEKRLLQLEKVIKNAKKVRKVSKKSKVPQSREES
jgi:hypothetical protein